MKTTRARLLSIYNIDSCTEFNIIIREHLRQYFDIEDNKVFDIDKYYLDRIAKECNQNQLDLLATIDITLPKEPKEPKEPKWDRVTHHKNACYLSPSGTGLDIMQTVSTRLKCYSFVTKEVAEQEAKIHNLMILMRNWARFHNALDNFVPDWDDSLSKYNISIKYNKPHVDTNWIANAGLFGISVSSKDRAYDMLSEFEKEIEEIIPYL